MSVNQRACVLWMPIAAVLASLLLECVGAFNPSGKNVARPVSNKLEASTMAPSKTRTLGLLTFDLDDTLFPTDEVVNDANQVMIETMHKLGFGSATEDSFLANTREIRKNLDSPITYSSLRMRAIQAELEQVSGSKVSDQVVEKCFNAWLEERHSAAERHLFPDAMETLEEIRSRYPGVCIAAVTNGRGNPLDMTNTLSPFFDFCVSGEDDDVFPHRKPHPKIYEATLDRYRSLYPDRNCDDDVWCHVGDCLANDVGASASLGALAIWVDVESDDEKQPVWSTATKGDLAARAKQKEAGRQSVSASIGHLAALPKVLSQLMAEQLE